MAKNRLSEIQEQIVDAFGAGNVRIAVVCRSHRQCRYFADDILGAVVRKYRTIESSVQQNPRLSTLSFNGTTVQFFTADALYRMRGLRFHDIHVLTPITEAAMDSLQAVKEGYGEKSTKPEADPAASA